MNGKTAHIILLILGIVLAVLLFLDILDVKISFMIFSVALAVLGVISKGFSYK